MGKKPYIPIYPGDWLKDLGDLTATCQGFALLLLFKIWESKTPGAYKTRISRLKNLVNLDDLETKIVLNELKEVDAFDFEEDGEFITIISRRMAREADISKKRSDAGKQGGRPRKAKTKQIKSKLKAKAKQNSDNDTDIDNGNEIDINNGVENEIKIKVWPTFEDFWDLYQKKVALPKAKASWGKLKQPEKEKAMAHVPLYVQSTPDKKYRLNPTTYLNNQGWENEIIENEKSTKTAEQELTEEWNRQVMSDPSV